MFNIRNIPEGSCASISFYQFANICKCDYRKIRRLVSSVAPKYVTNWFHYISNICIEKWWHMVTSDGFDSTSLPSMITQISIEVDTPDDYPTVNTVYACMSWWNRCLFYVATNCWVNNHRYNYMDIEVNKQWYHNYVTYMERNNIPIALFIYQYFTYNGYEVDDDGMHVLVGIRGDHGMVTEHDSNKSTFNTVPLYIPIYVDNDPFVVME